jgi:hypothetical protein
MGPYEIGCKVPHIPEFDAGGSGPSVGSKANLEFMTKTTVPALPGIEPRGPILSQSAD